jgi:nitrogen fixation protein FixH
VPDAYDRGLAYNQTLEERAAQAALGWTATFGAELTEGTTTAVTVELADAEGAPVTGAEVTMLFRRTTHDGEDTTFTLTDAGGGAYTAEIDLPGAGLWDVRGHAARDEGERLDFEDRLWLE